MEEKIKKEIAATKHQLKMLEERKAECLAKIKHFVENYDGHYSGEDFVHLGLKLAAVEGEIKQLQYSLDQFEYFLK